MRPPPPPSRSSLADDSRQPHFEVTAVKANVHAEYGAALDSSRTLSVCRLFLEAFVVLCICRRHIVPEISIYSVLTLTERVCFYKLICKPSSFFPPVFEKHHVGRVPRREGVVMSLRINTTMTALHAQKKIMNVIKRTIPLWRCAGLIISNCLAGYWIEEYL